MLVADDQANPYFKELYDAANEIAKLKAQITRLEKVVDGVLAQHLAGQEPGAGLMIAPDVPMLNDPHLDEQGDDAFYDAFDDHDQDLAVTEATDVDCQVDCEHDTIQTDLASVEEHFAEHDIISDDVPNDACSDDLSPTADETAHNKTASQIDAPLRTSSLPNALRSLICNPTKSALTPPDDLTLIKGIDCATALQLAANDTSRFQDIANLNREAIEKLTATIDGADRLHKQGWIEQAAMLAKGSLSTYARQTQDDRASKDTTFTLKPDLITLERASFDEAKDATKSEIIVDDKIDFNVLKLDQAAATLNELAMRDMPRTIHIERPNTGLMPAKDGTSLFFPMAAQDAGFAVKKIAHVAKRPARDYGNRRALSASLAATAAIIYVASTTTGAMNFNDNIVQLMQTDVCKLANWSSSYPDACRLILGNVL